MKFRKDKLKSDARSIKVWLIVLGSLFLISGFISGSNWVALALGLVAARAANEYVYRDPPDRGGP